MRIRTAPDGRVVKQAVMIERNGGAAQQVASGDNSLATADFAVNPGDVIEAFVVGSDIDGTLTPVESDHVIETAPAATQPLGKATNLSLTFTQ